MMLKDIKSLYDNFFFFFLHAATIKMCKKPHQNVEPSIILNFLNEFKKKLKNSSENKKYVKTMYCIKRKKLHF